MSIDRLTYFLSKLVGCEATLECNTDHSRDDIIEGVLTVLKCPPKPLFTSSIGTGITHKVIKYKIRGFILDDIDAQIVRFTDHEISLEQGKLYTHLCTNTSRMTGCHIVDNDWHTLTIEQDSKKFDFFVSTLSLEHLNRGIVK